MQIISTLRTQRQSLFRVIFLYAIALAILTFVALQPYVEISVLTRDSLAIADGKFYFGFLSNIGILIWTAASSICMFTFLLLSNAQQLAGSRSFFLYSSLLTLFLLLDDLFMMHEKVFPLYLNVNEKIILALYPIFISSFLLFQRKLILNSPYLVLLSALGFLGLSMVFDILFPNQTPAGYLLEDGFKFTGMIGWFYYFLQVSFSTLKNNLSATRQVQISILHKPLVKRNPLRAKAS